MRAAILGEHGKPVEVVDDVELSSPGPGEVVVEVKATGVCHSDLSIQNGAFPWPTPCVMGHEGAGIVAEVGEGVRSVAVGDAVVIAWVPHCGVCYWCTRDQTHLCPAHRMQVGRMADGRAPFRRGDAELTASVWAGTYAERTLLRESQVVRVGDDVPMSVASLVGCAVLTGVGAVFNTADVQPGDRVVVIGAGGVGLNVIQACRIAGASVILAVDPLESKRAVAAAMGATHTCEPDDAAALAKELTEDVGPDVAFEVVGKSALQRQAFDLTRAGGKCVLVGAPALGDDLTVPGMLGLFFFEKKLMGSYYGSCNVRRDVPKILGLWRAGLLDLEGLVSGTEPLDRVNDAFAALEAGETIRTILVP
ncbi:MAG TPA: Zn-dependent alcohol dehydrogenase [Actinomycetota bacterium]